MKKLGCFFVSTLKSMLIFILVLEKNIPNYLADFDQTWHEPLREVLTKYLLWYAFIMKILVNLILNVKTTNKNNLPSLTIQQ